MRSMPRKEDLWFAVKFQQFELVHPETELKSDMK